MNAFAWDLAALAGTLAAGVVPGLAVAVACQWVGGSPTQALALAMPAVIVGMATDGFGAMTIVRRAVRK